MEDKYSEILKPLWKKERQKRKKKSSAYNENVLKSELLLKGHGAGVTLTFSMRETLFFFLIVDFNFLFHKLQNNNPVISFKVLFQKYCVSHEEEISMFEYFTSKKREVTFRWISKMNYKFIADIWQSL
jgi:hypothetical protein